jgi:RluA family pseudouridine synthase
LIEILRRDREEPELRLIHRLDRETSGVLLLARSAEAARVWGRALMRGAFRKIYAARVLGRPPSPEGTVDQPIGREPGRRVFVRRKVMEGGEKAVTHYRLLRDDGDTCVLEFRPLTGRCHQLRVHAEWLGCPIVGDPLYGKPDYAYIEYAAQVRGRERLYLHAWKIEGEIAGRSVAIEAPLPEIFSRRELAWPPIRRPEF